jgi:hypothetical protein
VTLSSDPNVLCGCVAAPDAPAVPSASLRASFPLAGCMVAAKLYIGASCIHSQRCICSRRLQGRLRLAAVPLLLCKLVSERFTRVSAAASPHVFGGKQSAAHSFFRPCIRHRQHSKPTPQVSAVRPHRPVLALPDHLAGTGPI